MAISDIALARRSLRSALRDEIAERITSGRVAPGERLNESEIARELGVSQTPIREALLSLEGEAAIESDPRKGFRVLPLTVPEATDLYALVGNIERFALKTLGVPSDRVLAELDQINARFAKSGAKPEPALDLDSQWHSALFAELASPQIKATLGRLKQLLRRYELAYMKTMRNVTVSSSQHREISAALRQNKVSAAGKLLEENWLAGIEPMVNWLNGEKR